MSETTHSDAAGSAPAPHPGSKSMPRWNTGELIAPPVFRWQNIVAMLGPGILMGGAAIGGGEWLTGPTVTAKFGGGLMWLATASILGQMIYNLEISRYTLYCGEPIFSGKFRTLPGPMFWLFVYLMLDFGSVFPYLAANAATPLAALVKGRLMNPSVPADKAFLVNISYVILLLGLAPLLFGGKVYNALKNVMVFKIVVVMGFLILLGIFYSRLDTWTEIFGGFFKVGNVPIKRAEDANGNGILDPGEDWDSDGRLDVVEPELAKTPPLDTDGDGVPDSWPDFNGDGQPDRFVPESFTDAKAKKTLTFWWPDLNRDGKPDRTVHLKRLDGSEVDIALDPDGDGKPVGYIDVDGDGHIDGDNLENVFVSTIQGRPFPHIDLTMIAFLSAFVAISGSGGLSNTPVSNYTRDQGWGMGHHVGAIPSVVGGQNIALSHEGTVFFVTPESLERWKGWYRHIFRDQAFIWVPACLLGVGLPSMLSVQFLPRGFQVKNEWETPGMTAGAVQEYVKGPLGDAFWYMIMFCGFLVLITSLSASADGVIRRWVDVVWTASPTMRRLPTGAIRYVYFSVLTGYALFGVVMLTMGRPEALLLIATTLFNFALGFSCWHTLVINLTLLPKELRPNWTMRILLFLTGVFFWVIASVSAYQRLRDMGWL